MRTDDIIKGAKVMKIPLLDNRVFKIKVITEIATINIIVTLLAFFSKLFIF